MNYKVLEPIEIGNVELQNRVVYLAMAKGLQNPDGTVSDRALAYYKGLAEGGTGLIVTEALMIDPAWPSALPLQAGVYDEKFVPGLRKLVDSVHEAGSKIFFQLWHPGECAYTPGKVPKTVNELTVEEIQDIQAKYLKGAQIAKAAGVDGIEYQICHNYLGAQFFSPLFNKRTDEYGSATVENRLRFSIEVIRIIKDELGKDFPVAVKLQGSDFVEGGVTPEMASEAGPYLEKAGTSLITVSGGGSLTLITGMSAGMDQPEGWKVPFAQAVKKAVNIPVCATGNIRHPEFAENLIATGQSDLIGMGRGLLAEHDWVKKLSCGKRDEMRTCVSCQTCFGLFAEGDSGCTVNPFALREAEKEELRIDGQGKGICVVGSGPAGLEAAVTLGERGYDVTIFEKEEAIGGMIPLAVKPPEKEKLIWMMDYYQRQIDRLGIRVKLNTEATEKKLSEMNPYAVVFATGSLPVIPKLPGIDKDNVLTARDVLKEEPEITGKNIVVVGAGMTGVETAEMYFNKGNQVTVIDMLPPADPMTTPFEQMMLLGKVQYMGLPIMMEQKLLEIRDNEIQIEEVNSHEKTTLLADYVILSVGVESNNYFYENIKDRFERVYSIGDSNEIGKIKDAVLAGSKLGYSL